MYTTKEGGRVAVLLTESFQNNPNGAPGNADSGQPWVLTGPSQLVVFFGFLMLLPDALNGYAQVQLDDTPNAVDWQLVFPDDAATAALVLHDEDNFIGYNMGCHLVMTRSSFTFQVRAAGGEFVNVYSHVFATPYPANTLSSWSMSIVGSSVTLIGPDGSQHAFSDPRISELSGPNLVIQAIRSSTAQGTAWWVGVNASGPDEVGDIDVRVSEPYSAWSITPLPSHYEGRTMKMSVLSIEYVKHRILVDDEAPEAGSPVSLAFVRPGTKPEDATFHPATLEGSEARLLVDPIALGLPRGIYEVYVKVGSSPEAPAATSGYLHIY